MFTQQVYLYICSNQDLFDLIFKYQLRVSNTFAAAWLRPSLATIYLRTDVQSKGIRAPAILTQCQSISHISGHTLTHTYGG